MNLKQFPLFAAALAQGAGKRDYTAPVETALAALTNAIEDDAISNVVYKDTVKFYIGRAFEAGWETAIKRSFDYNREVALSPNEVTLSYALPSYPEAHKIGGMIKRIEETKLDTPYTRAMLSLLHEIAPIGAAIVSLKDKVVKRQPKPVEDRKAKYLAPIAGKEAVFAVKATLVEVTEKARIELGQRLAEHLTLRLQTAIELNVAEIALRVGQTSEARIAHRKAYDAYARFMAQDNFLYKLVDRNGLRVSNAEELIKSEATKRSQDIRESFVYKNLEKIDSILERKGDFDRIQIIGHSISLSGLEGSFKLTFRDGASFEMTNQVVFVQNQYGTQFNRFPLTFHNVVLNGGRRMKQPSEQKMNDVFPHNELA